MTSKRSRQEKPNKEDIHYQDHGFITDYNSSVLELPQTCSWQQSICRSSQRYNSKLAMVWIHRIWKLVNHINQSLFSKSWFPSAPWAKIKRKKYEKMALVIAIYTNKLDNLKNILSFIGRKKLEKEKHFNSFIFIKET